MSRVPPSLREVWQRFEKMGHKEWLLRSWSASALVNPEGLRSKQWNSCAVSTQHGVPEIKLMAQRRSTRLRPCP